MTKQPNLSRVAKLADFSTMRTVCWEPILDGCCFLPQPMTVLTGLKHYL